MNRLPTVVYAAVALASLVATTVQSEPIEAMVAVDAWTVDLRSLSGPASADLPGLAPRQQPMR